MGNSTQYNQTTEFLATLGDQAVRVVAKPGLPDWQSLAPSNALLAEDVQLAAGARVLLLGCGHGALAVALARRAPGVQVWLADPSSIALELSRLTLRRNGVTNGVISDKLSVLPDQAGAFDAVVIVAPQSRALARRWLVEAQAALRTGGQLFFAGPNDGGIRTMIVDAQELFGNGALLRYKQRHRVASAQKQAVAGAPDWASAPGIAPGTWHKFAANIGGVQRELHSLPGVFSYERIDDGTGLLLANLAVEPSARVLDIGCGYGAIGLAAAWAGAAEVVMVDSNIYAVAAAQHNIASYGLGNARAVAGDVRAGGAGPFDLVVTNPPFHTGKAVDHDVAREFVAYAAEALAPGGRFVLVANTFLRYNATLAQRFRLVETIASTSRYTVWSATLSGEG